MMRIVRIIILILGMCQTWSCSGQDYKLTVPIKEINTKGIYFEYTHLGNTYTGKFELGISKGDFYDTDSIEIRLSRTDPNEYEFISIVRRKWEEEKKVVSLDMNKREMLGYNDVDEKPIFSNLSNAYENESAIYDYFLSRLPSPNTSQKVGIYLVIDGEGNSTYKSSKIENQNQLSDLKKLIENMPKFSPPKVDGDTVSVIYLVEIPN